MKKGLIAIIIFTGIASVAIGQTRDTTLKLKPLKTFVSGTSIVKKALYKAFRVIQQDYYLIGDEGVPFGRGNQQYFGRHYGIGVVAKNVLWTEKQVLYPWLTDKSYKVLAADSLKPTQGKTQTAYFHYNYHACNCKYKELKGIKFDSIPLNNIAYYKLPGETPSVKLHEGEIPKLGIMVMFYTIDNEPMNGSTPVKMSITKQYVDWNDARTIGKLKKIKLPGKIIGGAFFSENFEMGTVGYHLAALYGRATNNPNQWVLTAFQNKFTSKLTVIKTITGKEGNRKKRRRKRRGRRNN
ncbi:hypothetical protein BKI52_22120 [marine bacterium AO1-C]|nr:hypothetical protein BKI52_22120 [marine bacterium AO1-C]